MIYLELLWAFFQIGLFSFGGGYAALPLIQDQIVTIKGWLSMTEFADLVTIAEMTPGPIAINSSTFVGTRIGGLLGAVVATLGCILPSCIIAITLAVIYKKYRNLVYVQGVLSGLRPAVVGMIASAGLSIIMLAFWNGEKISLSGTNFIAVALSAICVIILRIKKINPIFAILGTGVVGGLIYSII